MPAIQTSYTSDYSPGFVGMVANQETRNIFSRTSTDASLAFGVPVYQGATDNTVTATPGTAFVGFSVCDNTVAPSTLGGYGEGETAAIMTMGVFWTTAVSAAVMGEPVFVTGAGALSDQATGDTAVPGARFDSTAAANALVKIRVK